MADQRPIGVFDSGLGGLTVLQSLLHLLPNESFIYVADSGFCPYGSKGAEEVQERSVRITEFLMAMQAKLIVVACNTATAAAIDLLRGRYPMPFIGIEPAIKQAALLTRSGKVGVLATLNTFQGRLFQETSARYAGDKNVMITVGEGLVEVVEEDRMETPEARDLLESYIHPMLSAGVDQIVLGCTHYPFLIPAIRSMVPDHVVIHDPSPAVAKQTERILVSHDLQAREGDREHRFYTTGSTAILQRMLRRIGIHDAEVISIPL